MTHVVSCFIEYNKKILILKRSNEVRTYKGKWAGVSGYIEKGEEPLETAFKEIGEEIGLKKSDVKLVREGEQVKFIDGENEWIIHPFLFHSRKSDVAIDWEHSECRWIFPKEIVKYDTVPKLKEAMEALGIK